MSAVRARPLAAWCAGCAVAAALAAPSAVAGTDDAPDAVAEPAAAAGPSARVPSGRMAGLDERMRLLTAELKLDARQQLALRRVLEGRRDAIRRIWADGTVPAAERGPATRAVEDRTADQIRALLTDEQRKRYKPARPPPPPAPETGAPDVGKWMDAMRPKPVR